MKKYIIGGVILAAVIAAAVIIVPKLLWKSEKIVFPEQKEEITITYSCYNLSVPKKTAVFEPGTEEYEKIYALLKELPLRTSRKRKKSGVSSGYSWLCIEMFREGNPGDGLYCISFSVDGANGVALFVERDDGLLYNNGSDVYSGDFIIDGWDESEIVDWFTRLKEAGIR